MHSDVIYVDVFGIQKRQSFGIGEDSDGRIDRQSGNSGSGDGFDKRKEVESGMCNAIAT